MGSGVGLTQPFDIAATVSVCSIVCPSVCRFVRLPISQSVSQSVWLLLVCLFVWTKKIGLLIY